MTSSAVAGRAVGPSVGPSVGQVPKAAPGRSGTGRPTPGGSRGTRAIRGAALTALSNGVLPISSILSGPLLARSLSPEGRGEMAAVLAPLFVVTFIAAIGLPDAATYAIAKLGVPLARVMRTSSKMLIPIGLGSTALIWVAAPYIEHSTPSAVTDLRIASLSLPIMMYALVQRSAAAGAGRYGWVSLERTTAATVRLVLIIALVALSAMTAAYAVWTNILGNLVAAALLLMMISRNRTLRSAHMSAVPVAAEHDESGLDGRPLAARLWGYGLRGWGGVFANLVNWRLDQAILPALTGAIQIGYYAVAVSLAEVPSMIIGAVKQVVFTEASSASNLGLAARATRIVILLSLVADLILAAASNVIVPLLFGQDFEPAVKMARILLVANIPWTAEVVLATGLLAAGRPGLRSVGQIVAAVLTIVGLAILVPRYGGIGAAWTSLVAYSVNFFVSLYFFHRESGLPIRDSVVPRMADVRYLVKQGRSIVRGIRRRRAAGRSAARAVAAQGVAPDGVGADIIAEDGIAADIITSDITTSNSITSNVRGADLEGAAVQPVGVGAVADRVLADLPRPGEAYPGAALPGRRPSDDRPSDDRPPDDGPADDRPLDDRPPNHHPRPVHRPSPGRHRRD